MKETKLFRLWAGMTQDEIIQLRQAVESPVYATTLGVKKLYDILLDDYFSRKDTVVKKEELFEKIHSKQAYNDLKLRRYFSSLTKIITQYLAFKNLKEDKLAKEKVLSDIYEKAELTMIAHQKRQKLHDFIDKTEAKNDWHWMKKIELYDAEIKSSYLGGKCKKERLLLIKNLNDATDKYFAFAKIRQALLVKNYALIFKNEQDLKFLEDVKTNYQNDLLVTDSLFRLYLLSLQLTENQSDEVFFAYESLFLSINKKSLGQDCLLLFYMGLNYAIRQINQGKSAFYSVIFKWYKSAVENDYLLLDNRLSQVTFSNIVLNGITIGESEWIEKFAKKYIQYLPVDVQEQELQFTKAMIFFHRKDYNLAVDKLISTNFSPEYLFRTKTLLIRAYTELFLIDENYYSILESKIQSFESYLYRDKTRSESAKVASVNFCRILRRLVSRINNMNTEKQNKEWLEIQLRKHPKIVAKNWMKDLLNR